MLIQLIFLKNKDLFPKVTYSFRTSILRRKRNQKMNKDIMISVIMPAYNHEKYIKAAIESVLNQKTDFKIEMLIHDDASTDNTPAIIKEYEEKYPTIIKATYEKENQSTKTNLRRKLLGQKISGKYFAYLETDDYWQDNGKLQMQVDFLETHEDYSMCMHSAMQRNDVTGETKLLATFPEDGTYSQKDQILAGLGTNYPSLASFVFRTAYLKNMPDLFWDEGIGDYALRQYYASQGKVYYFKKPMSVYRTSLPQSYMGRLRQNSDFYNSYTIKNIRFFEKFDDYTKKQFSDILEKKIISDYLGFCSSIEEESGLKKAKESGLDLKKIDICYKCLSLKQPNTRLKFFCKKSKHIFIYGISRLGIHCKKQLEHMKINFEGFVVSDGQNKPEEIDGKSIFYLSDVLKKWNDPGFLLAVQPINENAILDILENLHIKNYYSPYAIQNFKKDA